MAEDKKSEYRFDANKGNYSAFDNTDGQANERKQVLEFYSLHTGETLKFKAFITSFSDQYSSEWNDEEAFGRMDPISTFKRTSRRISLAWDVPSSSEEEAIENQNKCSLLLSLLYPEYDGSDPTVAAVVKSAPLFRLKFSNLIQNSSMDNGGSAAGSGLLGKVSGFNYEIDLESGFFDLVNGKASNFALYPQTIKLSCEFTVLHEHPLGWFNQRPRNSFEKFPYAHNKELDSSKKTDSKTSTTVVANASLTPEEKKEKEAAKVGNLLSFFEETAADERIKAEENKKALGILKGK